VRTYTAVFAGASTQRLHIPGRLIEIMTSSAPIDIGFIGQLDDGPGPLDAKAVGLPAGVRMRPRGGFEGIDLTSASAQTVVLLIGNGDGQFNPRGLSIAGGSSVTDQTPVIVGTTVVSLIAAGSGRKSLRFRNNGTVPVAIGGSTVTLANSSIQIGPGQTWNEADAPDAAWHGIASAAGNSVAISVLA
jgi:hypothetical protein